LAATRHPWPPPAGRPLAATPGRLTSAPVPEMFSLCTSDRPAQFNGCGVLPNRLDRTPRSLTGGCGYRGTYLAGQLDGGIGRVGSVADEKIAPGGSASVFVLHEGDAGRDGDDGRVAGTVTLILD